jgi:hypothetical protein
MNPVDSTQGAQQIYNFWLGLIPQFLGQFGSAVPGMAANASNASAVPNGMLFPNDQIAKAAAMTQQSLQALAQSFTAMLQTGGVPNLLTQWANAAPAFAPVKPEDAQAAATAATQALFAPWTALMSQMTGAIPAMASQGLTPPALDGSATPAVSLQAMTQAWADMGRQLTGATPAQFDTAFDRTYGALSDAFGLGPARKLNAALREAVAAGIAQQDAQAKYAQLVQGAFTEGFQRLLRALAEKADAGERIDSMLALLRLWAGKTEEAVHETLQSEPGLAATAELTRCAFSYRNKLRHMAAAYADTFDMATRRELDDAYREIQALKRELRRPRAANERAEGSA